MLTQRPILFSTVLSNCRYFGIVLIIFSHLLKNANSISQIDSKNLLNDDSKVLSKFSGTPNYIRVNKTYNYSEQCENCTRVERSVDRILHRQKRFLVFPMGSAIVVTMAGVKGIIFSTPRGYNYLAEVDFYYPLPDKIYRLHHRTTTTTPPPPPPPSTMPPEIFDYHHSDYHNHLPTDWDHDHHSDDTGWDHDHPGEIFMPSGGWKDDIFKNINANHHSMDANTINMDETNSSRRYWNEDLPYRNSYNNIRPPSFQPKSRRRFDDMKTSGYYRGKRSKQNMIPVNEITFEHYGASYKRHRDRRSLYNQIESIFEYKGIQFRSCILRAICEAKHFLLPKGKSLFHDIFRILFTIPTKNEFQINDEYSNSARNHDDSENCWKLYENECPISVLDLLVKSQRIL